MGILNSICNLFVRGQKNTIDYNESGIQYWAAGQLGEAERMFRKAIELNPNHAGAYSNFGMILMEYGQFDNALRKLKYAIELNPEHAGAQMNLAISYQRGNNLTAALNHYRKAFELEPDLPQLANNYLVAMLEACDWEYISDFHDKLLKRFKQNDAQWKEQVTPFNALMLSVPPEFHKQLAIHEAKKIISRLPKKQYSSAKNRQHKKIRIGYVSWDFRNNPVSHLTAGMYGLHDRSNFEIYTYAFTPDDENSYLKKIQVGSDKFINLSNDSAEQSAQKIAEDEIDILLDMTGYSGGCRPEIFALRPAPIQINYLGYPASMGADFIDYFITDRTSIPEDYQRFFTEKAIILPHSYLPTDDQQPPGDEPLNRADYGLPEDAVVFCAFHRHVKLEPVIFDAWLRIMKAVPKSVLWLRKGSTESQEHLQAYAEKSGISRERVIFNTKATLSQHLARHRLATLFLDTHIYNGHTTCCDALWAGLPVVTWRGEAFVSRGSSGLLRNLGLAELCADTLEQYEKIIIDLSKDPQRLKAIREKLHSSIRTSPVFNTKLYVSNLERAYLEVWKNYLSGESRDIKLD